MRYVVVRQASREAAVVEEEREVQRTGRKSRHAASLGDHSAGEGHRSPEEKACWLFPFQHSLASRLPPGTHPSDEGLEPVAWLVSTRSGE